MSTSNSDQPDESKISEIRKLEFSEFMKKDRIVKIDALQDLYSMMQIINELIDESYTFLPKILEAMTEKYSDTINSEKHFEKVNAEKTFLYSTFHEFRDEIDKANEDRLEKIEIRNIELVRISLENGVGKVIDSKGYFYLTRVSHSLVVEASNRIIGSSGVNYNSITNISDVQSSKEYLSNLKTRNKKMIEDLNGKLKDSNETGVSVMKTVVGFFTSAFSLNLRSSDKTPVQEKMENAFKDVQTKNDSELRMIIKHMLDKICVPRLNSLIDVKISTRE